MNVIYKISSFLILTIFSHIGQCKIQINENSNHVASYPLLMPNVSPKVPELYLCTPVRVDSSKDYYIIGFEPNATMQTAHHMLIYGCTKPGSSKSIWNCGEMTRGSTDNGLPLAAACSGGSQIIYAWAKNALRLNLPKDVGFKVGGQTKIQYLVLQVHYAHVDHFLDGSTDDSGVFLHYTLKPMSNQAGVYLLGTGGSIRARSTELMEVACSLDENKTIYPFAYRVHTHSLGHLVSGYAIEPRTNEWIELGKMDPQRAQMFYPIHNKNPIYQNFTLAARCTMISNRDRVTYIGSTNKDEMCNFYLMYYVKGGEPLNDKYCFSAGPPFYSWKTQGYRNIPDKEASTMGKLPDYIKEE
ncbi:peptidylglycine alpha-hydroxylating monooxygenase [Leptopilina heterotoma]|uniref:peptidylglycine alpha-hydroxylating monooxygenase n=1 Tax=Leptopilina heterotoma TaxID=63436 RepID=UPI001CA835BB|nr:peptidylglycine alpha-hydroxylating monooxygenase [Leptopilina heterotoma]